MYLEEGIHILYGYIDGVVDFSHLQITGKYYISFYGYILPGTYPANVITHVETFVKDFSSVEEILQEAIAYFRSDPRNWMFSKGFIDKILQGEYSILNCDVANRVLFRQRVFIQELVNFYSVSIRQEYYNPLDLDFVNVLYIVDRNETYQQVLGKTVGQIRGMMDSFRENVFLVVEAEEDSQVKRDIIQIYNKSLYYTVYSRREINDMNNATCVKVFQIWDVSEVNDIVKRFDNSLEGAVLFNNVDNEILDRESRL